MGNIHFDGEYGKYAEYELSAPSRDNRELLDSMCRSLNRAIRSELTPHQFRVISFYYVENLRMADIAELLGVSIPTVSKTIKRGRARLQRCLKYCTPEYFRPPVE